MKGTVEHPFSQFTTLPALAPIIEAGSEHAAGIGSRTATFEANINPDYQGVGCELQYVTKETFESATLNGKVNVLEGTANYYFEYGQEGQAEPTRRPRSCR